MSDTQHSLEDEKPVASPDRRTLLKKVAYTAPALVVLGVVIPITNGYAASPPKPPCPPGVIRDDCQPQ